MTQNILTMVMDSIKNIIFDLGGVMLDLDIDRCIESFTRIGCGEIAKHLGVCHSSDIFMKLERGELNTAQLCDGIREISQSNATNEEICAAYNDFLIGIPLHKLRLLDKFREQGYNIYALSNINEIVMGRVREFFAADGKSMDEYFDKAYLSFEVGALKPNRDIFEMMIADSGIIPEESLFIDDSQHNVMVGSEFGLQVYMPAARENFDHIFEL